MVGAGFPKPITQPVAALTLLAFMATACPSPVLAQLPTVPKYPPAPPNASPAQQPAGTYTLGGGDNIRIDVFDLPQFSGEYQIPAGGAIQLPLIGSISVQGMTLEDAANAISAAYSRFLKRPLITVSLLATRPLNIWISGEVSRPGSYSLPLASGGGNRPSVQFPTLVQALEKAMGVTLAADIRRVQLRRRLGAAPEQVITYDLEQYLQTGNLTQDITLRDGDSIFVPTATSVNLGQVRQLADVSFATATDQPRTVGVSGEVNRPGTYVITGGNTTVDLRPAGLPTVTRAIQLAGGIKPLADIRQVQIRRPTKAGAEQIFNVDLWQLLQTGDVNQDTIVQSGDTILVPTATAVNPAEITQLAEANFSPPVIQVSVVGEVRGPGVLRVPPSTTLNQALLTAGGFLPGRSQKDSVELIRLNFDGTVSKRTVEIDLAQGINEGTNPVMRNNDIIVVRRTGMTRFVDNVNTAVNPTASGVLALFSIPNVVLGLLNTLGIIKLNN